MLYTSLNLDKSLEFATFCITVVGAVGDDDVVEETDVHQLAGTGKGLGEVVVHLAGMQTARGVVVAHGHDGGVGQQGFLHEDADVDQHFADAAVGDALLLDEAVVLVHEQQPELLDVEVLQHGAHVVVDACCRS